MKWFPISLIGLLAISLSLASCSVAPSTEIAEQGVIGIALLVDDPFFLQMSEALTTHAKVAGYEVVVAWANLDQARQEKQVEDFIKRRVDAIVLCPVDSTKAVAARKANGAGIPVFTADIAVLAEGVEIVSHVATDNFRGGQLAANAMFESLGGNGRVAIIDHPTVDSVILRARGFVQRLAELRQNTGGKIELVARSGGPKYVCWFDTPEQLLLEQPDIDGIFALNDTLALSVVTALEKENKLDNVVVVGFDGQPAALEALHAGKITADVIQHPELIAEIVISAIVDYRTGKDVPAEQLISPTIRCSDFPVSDLPRSGG